MGATSVGVGLCNMFAFLKVDGQLQLQEKKKELVGAKESQVLEIKLQYRNTVKKFVDYISFLYKDKYEEIVIKAPDCTKTFEALALTWRKTSQPNCYFPLRTSLELFAGYNS